jgi:hypothetical protein
MGLRYTCWQAQHFAVSLCTHRSTKWQAIGWIPVIRGGLSQVASNPKLAAGAVHTDEVNGAVERRVLPV